MTSLATDQTYASRPALTLTTAPPAVRWPKVADAKAAIRDGRYDDPSELDKGLDDCLASMLADLAE